MLTSLSRYVIHDGFASRPAPVVMSVRVDGVPEPPEPVPIVIRQKKGVLHQKPVAPAQTASPTPAHVEPSLPQPGVAVAETLFLQPIPARVSNPLLMDSDYRTTTGLSQMPEALAIKVPNYPRQAATNKTSGWVVAMLFLDERGTVVDTVAITSSESFNEYEKEVAQHLQGSIFSPGKLDGREVKARVFIKVNFDARALSGLETAKDPVTTVPADMQEQR
jgi:hypothetical protein